ncbi:hypothetical protein HAX54_047059 [Datura stramonium]|uniref:Uncharacterized protein n=1 Tax=Datura stramonium TaxID=4076 RepID=A0ABS8WLL2_DATST|nr:hypothetical protein [Datura stramonium]
MSPNNFSGDVNGFHGEMSEADVQIIVTSGRLRIPAHSNRPGCCFDGSGEHISSAGNMESERTIRILGVPCDAVSVFIQFLYSFQGALKSIWRDMGSIC